MSCIVNKKNPDKELEHFWVNFKSTICSVSYNMSLGGFLWSMSSKTTIEEQVDEISKILNSYKNIQKYDSISRKIVQVYDNMVICLITTCGKLSKQYETNSTEYNMDTYIHEKSSIEHVLQFSKRWVKWKCFKTSGHFLDNLTSVHLLTIVNVSFSIENISDKKKLCILAMSYIIAKNVETLFDIFNIGIKSCKSTVIDMVSKIAILDNFGSNLTDYVMETYHVNYSLTTKGHKIIRMLS